RGRPVTVASGAATTNYALRAGTPGGTYTIQIVYSGTSSFAGFTDTSHSLTISAAATATAAVSASTVYSGAGQTVTLSSTVTSTVGVVNQGTATFTLLNTNIAAANPITVNVINGGATADYLLPAGTP